MHIIAERLRTQHLIGKPLPSPEAVVQLLTAVQSQDYPGAKWGIAQRTHATNAAIDKLFDDGAILRTHVMRPTWHFVLPADIAWLQMLTAPRVKMMTANYHRKIGLEPRDIPRSQHVFARLLENKNYQTRTQLKHELEKAKIDTAGLKLGFLIMEAELDALICSGPHKGKQHTYALVADRAPHAKKMTRDEALAELANRYFTSHGPAQVQDMAWWSGLTLADVKAGISATNLQKEVIDDKTYYFNTPSNPTLKPPLIHLLPNYDEYLIAYKDRSAFFDPTIQGLSIGARDMALANHIIICDGRVVGGWRRTLKKGGVVIQIKLLRKLAPTEATALDQAATQYAGFLGLPQAELIYE